MKTNKQQRSYLKQRRIEARANGLCATCCKRKPSVGRKTCETCLNNRPGRERVVANPFCLDCLATHPRGAHVIERRLLRPYGA